MTVDNAVVGLYPGYTYWCENWSRNSARHRCSAMYGVFLLNC